MALDKEERIRSIIEEFLSAQNVSEELTQEFRAWFLGSGHIEEKARALEAIMKSDIRFELEPGEDTKEAYKRIAKRLGFTEDSDQGMQDDSKNNNRPLRRMVPRVAAALIPVTAMLGATLYILNRHMPAEQSPVASEVHFQVPAGERKNTVLPDESSVWVNSDSEITYDDNFEDDRVVELDGEAYFNVTRDKDKPFRVTSGDMAVTVLGTVFSIENIDDGTTEVALYEGLVRIDLPEGSHLLSTGHELRYNKLDGTVSVSEMSRTKPDWMRNIIDFSLQPASDVLNSIGRIYGYNMHMTEVSRDKLAKNIVTLKFEGEIEFREVLSIMSYMSGFTYSINDKEVYITPLVDQRQREIINRNNEQ